jgi:type I restriction enzyme S subunit
MSELPQGWAPASFGELMAPEPNSLTDGPFGTRLKTAHYVSVGPRVVRLGNISVGEFLANDEAHIAWDHYETLLKHRVFPGDLLIAGLADPVGRCCLAPSDIGDAIVKADCFRAKPHPELTNAYLMHYLNSPQGREALEANSHGLGRLRINLRDLRAVPVPVAPVAEQHRIVAKLDSLFEHTRRARDELSHVPRLIENYRKTILEAAFCGVLTKSWRQKNGLSKETWLSLPFGTLVYGIKAGKNLRCEERPPRDDERGVIKVSAVTWGTFA